MDNRMKEGEEDVLRLRRAYWSVLVMDWEAACHSGSQRQMELFFFAAAAAAADRLERAKQQEQQKQKQNKKQPRG